LPTNSEGIAYLYHVGIKVALARSSAETDPQKAKAAFNRAVDGRDSGSLFGKIVPALSS